MHLTWDFRQARFHRRDDQYPSVVIHYSAPAVAPDGAMQVSMAREFLCRAPLSGTKVPKSGTLVPTWRAFFRRGFIGLAVIEK